MSSLRMSLLAICVLVGSTLGGCGGGSSGSGNNGTSNTDSVSLSFSPGSLSANLLQGLSTTLSVTATATVHGTISGTLYVVIVDASGVMEPNPEISSVAPGFYTTVFTTNPSLPVGEQVGSLQVKVCGDPACGTLYGTASLPYDFKVTSATNLTTLSPLTGANDWQTYQGNMEHTGFVPVTLDASAFSPRWLIENPHLSGAAGVYVTVSPVVSDSAKQLAFFSSQNTEGDSSYFYAVHEHDGTLAWSVDLTATTRYQYPSHPAIFNDTVYATIDDGSGTLSSSFVAYDAQTGTVKFKQPISSGIGAGEPVVSGNTAYVAQVRAFDATTGAPLWSSATNGNSNFSPTLDSQNVYFYVPNSINVTTPGFSAVDQASGSAQFAIGRPAAPLGSVQISFSGGTPVLDGAGGAVVALSGDINFSDPLDHFNFSTQTLDWEIQGIYSSPVALAGGTVYAGNSSPYQMEARSVTNGQLLWSWAPPTADGNNQFYGIVATNNLLFVSTDMYTYAVDMTTHAAVWSYPMGGELSISRSGILYINGPTNLAAVNLH